MRLRYPDGTEEELHIGDTAEAGSGQGDPVLTADSPLGLALTAWRSGDDRAPVAS